MAEQEDGAGQINLMDLSVEQLDSLRQQLEAELKQLTTSFSGLREAQARFQESKEALSSLNSSNLDKDVLVPLTSSMFVPGKLSNVSEVLVDVGTGYFVEQSVDDAKKFMDRKVAFLQTNTDNLKEVIQGKRQMLEGAIYVLQEKLKVAAMQEDQRRQ